MNVRDQQRVDMGISDMSYARDHNLNPEGDGSGDWGEPCATCGADTDWDGLCEQCDTAEEDEP